MPPINCLFFAIALSIYSPFLNKKKLPATDEQWAQAVYRQLLSAKGVLSSKVPTVIIDDRIEGPASYSNDHRHIYINNKTLSICKSFGRAKDDALAFLLAHELIHFYQKRHPHKQLSFTGSSPITKEEIEHYRQIEYEADLYGALLAYIAGYKTYTIIPTLLSKIYKDFDLQEQELIAVPFEVRKKIAEEACEEVGRLKEIFNAGNLFFAIGQYVEAITCFEYLLKGFESKALYNNLGLSYFLQAKATYPSKINFIYPITLAYKEPSLRAPKTFTFKELMTRAVQSFERATHYDNTDYSLYFNLAAAYHATGNQKKFSQLLLQMKHFNLTAVQGVKLTILETLLPDNINFTLELLNAIDTRSLDVDLLTLLQANKNLLANKAPKKKKRYPRSVLERIGNTSIHELPNKLQPLKILLHKNQTNGEYSLATKLMNNYIFYYMDSPYQTSSIQVTNSPKYALLNKFTRGDLVSTITTTINEQYHIIPHSKGYYLIYEHRFLLLDFNTSDELINWAIFKI